MNSEQTEDSYKPPVAVGAPRQEPSKSTSQNSESRSPGMDNPAAAAKDDGKRQEATVIVRGEAVRAPDQKAGAKDKPQQKPLSEAKVKMQNRLPALADDDEVGVDKEHVVGRDGKADLTFRGRLLASAAPNMAPKGKWEEYRIYETDGGKHVFSKVGRSIVAEDEDTHAAEIFDPAPSSVPAQVLRSARELTRSEPLTWRDAAVSFFGYDALAKVLYRKFGTQFEEHIN